MQDLIPLPNAQICGDCGLLPTLAGKIHTAQTCIPNPDTVVLLRKALQKTHLDEGELDFFRGSHAPLGDRLCQEWSFISTGPLHCPKECDCPHCTNEGRGAGLLSNLEMTEGSFEEPYR